MIKIILLYTLLVVSIAVPPLLLVSLPLLYLYVRGIVRRRRAIVTTVEAVIEARRTDQIVRYFR